MIKGWMGKLDSELYPEKVLVIFGRNPIEGDIPVVVLPTEKIGEVKKYIENVRIMARNDPEGLAKEIIKDSEKALKLLEE